MASSPLDYYPAAMVFNSVNSYEFPHVGDRGIPEAGYRPRLMDLVPSCVLQDNCLKHNMHRGKKVTLAGLRKAYEHLLQKSKRHKKDVLLTDPLGERKSVMDEMHFEPVFRHVKNFEELQSHAKETSVSPEGNQRKLVGTRFICSPPDAAQALLHALPEAERRDMLQELQDTYDEVLESVFGTQPRVIAIHTDKVRLHIEAIVLKFQENLEAHPAFKGTSRGHTDDTSRAVTAAQFGGRWRMKFFHCRMAHAMTCVVMDKIRSLYMSAYDKGREACLQRLAIANEYLDFLSVATTDETLSARNSVRKSADFIKRPKFPFRAYLDESVPDPEPVQNPPNFILRARIRVHRILMRRVREKNWLRRELSRQARTILFSFARRPHISARFKDPDGDAMVKAAAMEIVQAQLMIPIEEGILFHHSRSVRELGEYVKASPETIPGLAEEGASIADAHPESATEEPEPVIKNADKPEAEPAGGDSARRPLPIESHDLPEDTKDSIVPSSPTDGIPPPGLSEVPDPQKLRPQPGFFNDHPEVEAPRIPADPLFDEWMKHYRPTPMEHEMMRQEGGLEKFLSLRVKEFEERRPEIVNELKNNERTEPIEEDPKI